MNKVDLTGRLTKDPQSRWTNGQESQETEDEMRKTGMNLNALWQATRMNQSPKQIREIAEAIRESARDMAAEAIQTAAMAEKLIQYTERQEE